MIYFELFYVFFLIGLFTLGGGYAMIPMIEDQVVSRGWINGEALSDFIAISESTPGPFAINIATFIGSQVKGPLGSICSTIGVILPSFIIIFLIAALLTRIMRNRFIKGALKGVRPVVLALILATAFTFFIKLIFSTASGPLTNYVIKDTYRGSLTMLLLLSTFYIGYQKRTKKNLNPILLLAISASLGILFFLF